MGLWVAARGEWDEREHRSAPQVFSGNSGLYRETGIKREVNGGRGKRKQAGTRAGQWPVATAAPAGERGGIRTPEPIGARVRAFRPA
jgi:hypothetical protein